MSKVMTLLVVGSAIFATCSMAQESVPYCSELKQINNYAMTSERFAPIVGEPRTGNYRTTTLPLTGWTDCLFYGTSTYTCDSPGLKTRGEAASTQQRIARDLLACFAGTWIEAPDQMSPDFIVLHPKLGPASITLNLDQNESGEHVVRLIIFLRRL